MKESLTIFQFNDPSTDPSNFYHSRDKECSQCGELEENCKCEYCEICGARCENDGTYNCNCFDCCGDLMPRDYPPYYRDHVIWNINII
jgi:hypothetical protein